MIPEPDNNSPTWPYVLAFAKRMEYKLSLNRHKGDREAWLRDSPESLSKRIADEHAELNKALLNLAIDGRTSREKVANEAADVGNFAMMVADVVWEQRKAAK